MADMIKLTPQELLAQSAEMSALQGEFESLFADVKNVLSNISGDISEKMAQNFEGKILGAQKSFSSILAMLGNGSAATRLSASSFSDGTGLSSVLGTLMNSEISTKALNTMLKDLGKDLDPGTSEWITEMISQGKNIEKIQEAVSLITAGDYEGALRMAANEGIDWIAGGLTSGIPEGSWVETLNEETGGLLKLTGLEKSFYKNWIGSTVDSAVDFYKLSQDPNVTPGQLVNTASEYLWNMSGADAIINTGADGAFDVIKQIPLVGDWYTEKGATDGISAIGIGMGEVAYMITGDQETADYYANYYSDHGGLAGGIASGIEDIAGYFYESIFQK